MALGMGMMVCVRSCGGRWRRRHSESSHIRVVRTTGEAYDIWSRAKGPHVKMGAC